MSPKTIMPKNNILIQLFLLSLLSGMAFADANFVCFLNKCYDFKNPKLSCSSEQCSEFLNHQDQLQIIIYFDHFFYFVPKLTEIQTNNSTLATIQFIRDSFFQIKQFFGLSPDIEECMRDKCSLVIKEKIETAFNGYPCVVSLVRFLDVMLEKAGFENCKILCSRNQAETNQDCWNCIAHEFQLSNEVKEKDLESCAVQSLNFQGFSASKLYNFFNQIKKKMIDYSLEQYL